MCLSLWKIFFPYPLDRFISLLSPIPPDFKFNPRHYVNNTDTFIRCQNSFALHFGRTFTFSTPRPFIHFSLPPPTHPSLHSHGCFQTDPRPMCTRCPPNSTPSRSLSLLTPLFDTDRWNCYQYWLLSPCLSLCLPHSTLSILSSFLLSLTKWKISREKEWVERESARTHKTEIYSLCSQHMGWSPGFSWATFSVMFCPCRTLGCLHFYEMWFSWLHTASRRPRWNR